MAQASVCASWRHVLARIRASATTASSLSRRSDCGCAGCLTRRTRPAIASRSASMRVSIATVMECFSFRSVMSGRRSGSAGWCGARFSTTPTSATRCSRPTGDGGYAIEATRAVMGHAASLGIARVVAIVTPRNESSVRVLRAPGLRYAGRLEGPEGACDLYSPSTTENRPSTDEPA